MKNYKEKINELQKQIEEKAKELGRVQHLVEELTRQREALGISITRAEKDVQVLKDEKLSIEQRIKEAGERLQSAVSPFKKKISSLEEAVQFVQSTLKDKQLYIKEIEELEAERGMAAAARQEAILVGREVSKKVTAELSAYQKAKEITEAEVEKAKKISEDLENQRQAISREKAGMEQWGKHLQFLARRLYKFYKEKNLGFPEDLLENFKPLKYFPSRSLEEKLRIKKMVTNLKP